MKKLLSVILAVLLVTSLFSACASTPQSKTENDKISVVTTVFPVYDWVRNIIGDDENAEVTFLLDNGADLHNYQPTADDMIQLSDCDMFIYVGGESDEWVEDALKNKANPEMSVLNLMELLGDKAKEEELKEGMQGEEHDHEHEEDHEDEEHEEEHEDEEHEEEQEEPEYDEHIWLSLKNAQVLVNAIAEKLNAIGNEGNAYLKNAAAYNAQLSALDKEYADAVANAKVKTLLFGDRFPFRYLTDDYGLDYYAAFIGCSAETEASFETISFLAQKTDELKLNYVMTIENSDCKIAETIIKNTKSKSAKVLTLNSLQSVSKTDAESGATYLAVMQSNLDVLKTALGI